MADFYSTSYTSSLASLNDTGLEASERKSQGRRSFPAAIDRCRRTYGAVYLVGNANLFFFLLLVTMKLSLDQSAYWDGVTDKKTFSHGVDWQVLQSHLVATATPRILDFGCGYGRLTHALHTQQQGRYKNVIGVDNSLQMIQRAQRQYPDLMFRHVNEASLPFQDDHFDLVCLFAVLTGIPRTTDQHTLVTELSRVLKPGTGLLYISDMLLNSDERNVLRYQAAAEKYKDDANNYPYGVFDLQDEGTHVHLRHHALPYIQNDLLGNDDWDILYTHTFAVTTMNGNPSNAFQIIAQKRA